MDKAPRNFVVMSRARRITGVTLLVIGGVLIARVGWLGVFHGSYFGRDEWIRFYGLLWFGIVFGLLGGWLAFRSRAAAWALLLVVAAPFIMAYANR